MLHQLLQSLSAPFLACPDDDSLFPVSWHVLSLSYSRKKSLQDGYCELWVCLEELCLEVVISWSFSILKGLYCLDYLSFIWDRCVDVKVGLSFQNVRILCRW